MTKDKNINNKGPSVRLLCTLCALGTICYLGACKKFVSIDPHVNKIVTSSVFSNSATATSAVTAMYVSMQQNDFQLVSEPCALLSDELNSISTSGNLPQYYTNSMLATNIIDPWSTYYNDIYSANAIIEGLQNNTHITAHIAQQLTGEAKFLRAWYHFYLTNLYGDIPVVTSTDYTINKSITRTPQALVYQQIISDLTDAGNLLNSGYVDLSDTTVYPIGSAERVRPNKSAAAALLARAYLYAGQYSQAEQQANSVINNSSLYSLCTNLAAGTGNNYVFQKNSTEAILQLQTALNANAYTPDGQTYVLTAAPSTGSSQFATISSQLQAAFEPNDNRFTQWVGVYTAPSGMKYYYPKKYQYVPGSYNNLSSIPEYVMMLRLGEQYLIRAEARAQQGNLQGAIDDVNTLRLKHGGLTTPLPIPADKASALAVILHERQVELFCEWGHRWLDLKRTGNLNTVMGAPGNAYAAKGGIGSWNPQWALFPVPQSELSNNPSMTQNPGY